VDVLLEEELDVLLDVLLDDVLVAGGLVGLGCPATTVDAVVVGAAVVDADEAATGADVPGAVVDGTADVDGAADVSIASEVDGWVAGASVFSGLPFNRNAPPTMTAASVAPPAMPARRRLMPRARANTASWAFAVPSAVVPMSGARWRKATPRSSSNGSKSLILVLPRAAA
jgi:hypothetical protein